MYQNQGDLPVVIDEQPDQIPSSKVWKGLAIAGILGSAGFIGVSMRSTFGSSSISKRIELARSGDIQYSTLSDDEVSELFSQFKKSYSKEYDSSEESDRFENFVKFLEKVDERNAAESASGGSATHGITIFADLSEDEFKENFLGYKASTSSTINKLTPKKLSESDYEGKKSVSETLVNWAGVYTTPVKDQGYCGSCWAFSATEQIESDSIRKGYLTTDDSLSEQQIVSCDSYSDGCDGGSTEAAYYYVYEAGGLEFDSEYPYTSYYDHTGTCKSDSSDYVVTVDAYYLLENEVAMKQHIMTTGPLSICLDASTWASYTSGIVTTCGKDVDHCVQLVGINVEESYWIVRNSWGTSWGEDGYIYLKYGENLCDITYDPTFVEPVNLQ